MSDSMRLKWLPVNCAYAFTWHGQLIRLSDSPMFYATKAEAKQAAAFHGLHVDTRGFVEATTAAYGNIMLTPHAYLSTSNGVWRVICQGMPLCADTSRELAEKVARHYGYTPETMAIWNGDKGEFIPAPAVSA